MREIIDDLLLHSKYIRQKEYWTNKLFPGFAGTALLHHCKRKKEPQKNIEKIEFLITSKRYNKLVELGKNSDLSIYIIFLTVLNILIYRYTNQKDIVVVSPVYKHIMSEDTLNDRLFIYNEMNDDLSFIQLLLKTRQSVLEAYENQDYPYNKLLESLFHLAPARKDKSITDMSNIVCLLKNIHDDINVFEDLRDKIVFSFIRKKQQVKGHIFYDANIYEKDYLKRTAVHFIKILEKSVDDIKLKVSTMTFYTEEEKQQLIFDFNNTESQYPQNKTLPQLFREQLERTPDRIALIGPHVKSPISNSSSQIPNKKIFAITYRELNKKSGQLADILRTKGGKPDTIVGIMVERSVEMIMSIMAVLKVRGAYLPIDPDYPGKRINYMLVDSGAKFLVTTPVLSEKIEELSNVKCQLLMVNEKPSGRQRLYNHPKEASSHLHPSPWFNAPVTSLAYIIYTSGTTGKPKGVCVEHSAVVNLAYSQKNQLGIDESDRVLQFSNICFDASVEQIFIALFSGSILVIIDKETLLDHEQFEMFILKEAITHLNAVPSFLNTINLRENSGLKRIISGGDFCPLPLARKLSRYCDFYNQYGPTETTVTSLGIRLKEVDETLPRLPVGKPINNTTVYLLDPWMNPVPLGVVGELYIGGDGIARGYLNNPELTAEKFDHDLNDLSDSHDEEAPFGQNNQKLLRGVPDASRGGFLEKSPPGRRRQKIYKTGDLARWLLDGNIEFWGRIDQQVKIRGFRIELGEIERVLLKHKEIKDALVIKRDIRDESHLCAYIVPVKDIDLSKLRDYLSGELPDYMHPVYFVTVERIPLTVNGKVNVNRLPEPEMSRIGEYEAPGNQLEEKLVEIWAGVLGIEKDKIGINVKFLELGGHSLKAIKLVAEIHKKFNVRIPLHKIFDLNTIKALSGYIGEAANDEYVQIEPVEEREYYLLTSAQKRIYILHKMDLKGTAYNTSHMMILEGFLQKERFKEVFVKLIKRHESFRTSFELVDSEPVQRIHRKVEFEIEYFDFQVTGALNHGNWCRWEQATQIPNKKETRWHHSFIRPFDLSQAPLLRVGLSRTGDNRHILVLDMPHIITDGISTGIMAADLMKLYAKEELPGLRLQYKDYSQWQYKFYVESEVIEKQEQYWLAQFNDETPLLNLPTDYARPTLQEFEGDITHFTLGRQETQQLNALGHRENVSLFMVLLAVFNVLLAKVSGQEDIVIGTSIEGRTHKDLREISGLFANTLALRNFPQKHHSFKQFLEELKKRTIKAFENQEYSFDDLVEKLKLKRVINRNPLFDVVFQLNNFEINPLTIPGLILRPFDSRSNISKHDLMLMATEDHEKLYFSLQYSTKLFKRETIEQMITYFKEIISAVLADPANTLSAIQEMPKGRRKKQLSQLDKYLTNELNLIKEKNNILQDRLLESLRGFSHKIAIQYGSRAVTYRYLDKNSNYIANWLLNKRINKETFIGVLMEDRVGLIVTMIGIFKAGCVFVPLDSSYPRTRLDLMIRVSGTKLVFTDGADGNDRGNYDQLAKDKRYQGQSLEFIPMGTGFFEENNGWFDRKPVVAYGSKDKIYVYFTSGTTGIPRAILGKNIGLDHFIDWEINTFAIDDTFRISQLTTVGFDAFLRDVLVPLCTGGMICIPPGKDITLNPDELIDWLECWGVNLIHCVPGLFRLICSGTLNQDNFKTLKFILISGEKINPSDLVGWYQMFGTDIQLVNLWGTSETTLAKTYYFIQPSDTERERIPVGKPIIGAAVSILNEEMNWCDKLVTGDIYIHTPYRTYGYYNEPELTNKKFIQNPLNNYSADIMHATGDKGRLLSDGNIDLLGRNDRQVKIHGIRIEPEEIESILTQHPWVKEAVVLKQEELPGNEWLCAYITENCQVEIEETFFITNLNEYLSGKLPTHMVPSRILTLEKMPRTPNGKIDYEALPDPLESERGNYSDAVPGNQIEHILLKIWREILHKENIGVTDHFYDLGGNSLNVMALISKIHQAFDKRIPLRDIFNNPTIKKQAEILKNYGKEEYISIAPAEEKEYYPVSSAQKRLYILQQMEVYANSYKIAEIVELQGEIDLDMFKRACGKLMARHECLRTSFELIEDEPVQRIHPEVEFKIEYGDLQVPGALIHGNRCRWEEVPIGQVSIASVDKTRIDTEGHHSSFIVHHFFIRSFDLSRAPLLRVGLIDKEEEKSSHILMVDMHHIISDGTSMAILIKEFMAYYQGKELPPLRIRYKDYSQWQNRLLESHELKKQETYWLKLFAGEIPVMNNLIDYARSPEQGDDKDSINIIMDKELTAQIQEMTKKTGTTIYMLLLAVYNILLLKYTGQEDIVVGSGIAGRTHADLENIIGMFVNMLPMRNRPNEDKAFSEFLEEVKKNTLEAFENQDYPFDRLVMKLGVQREYGRNPLFDTQFTFQNMEMQPLVIPGLSLKPYNYKIRTRQFDLSLNGIENGEIITLVFSYSSSLFKRTTVEKLGKHYTEILEQVVKNQHMNLKDIKISRVFVTARSGLSKKDALGFEV